MHAFSVNRLPWVHVEKLKHFPCGTWLNRPGKRNHLGGTRCPDRSPDFQMVAWSNPRDRVRSTAWPFSWIRYGGNWDGAQIAKKLKIIPIPVLFFPLGNVLLNSLIWRLHVMWKRELHLVLKISPGLAARHSCFSLLAPSL